jgi:hypothetical protein
MADYEDRQNHNKRRQATDADNVGWQGSESGDDIDERRESDASLRAVPGSASRARNIGHRADSGPSKPAVDIWRDDGEDPGQIDDGGHLASTASGITLDGTSVNQTRSKSTLSSRSFSS